VACLCKPHRGAGVPARERSGPQPGRVEAGQGDGPAEELVRASSVIIGWAKVKTITGR
jgi:hypothetical protein